MVVERSLARPRSPATGGRRQQAISGREAR